MMRKYVGWDIGGAHLKATLLSADGEVIEVMQLPCPLWLGLDKLESAILMVLDGLHIKADEVHHAVTMTGELVDLFPSRQAGVMEITHLAANLLGKNTLFYCISTKNSEGSFVTIDDVLGNASVIASANWHASASLLSQQVSSGLLVDIGSTTTDIIAIVNGKVVDNGATDASRMQQDSLVYSGVVRTPAMALAHKITFESVETNVAAELFATMADVYRLTGELLEGADLAESADGQGKTIAGSARRLARMVGHDMEDKPMDMWRQLAFSFRAVQLNQIKHAVLKHIQTDMPIVGAGAGAFLVKEIASELGHDYAEFSEMLNKKNDHPLSTSSPAYAVARLAFLHEAYIST